MHLRRSHTGYPGSSCFFTSGNRKKSQGERSGEYGWYGSSCTSLSLRKGNRCCYCVRTGIVMMQKKGHRVHPVFGRRCHQISETFGRQWCTYQSAVTVRLLSSRGTVVTWPDFPSKQAIIFFCALRDYFEFLVWALVRKQPKRRWQHLGFRIISIDPSSVTYQHFLGQF